MFERCVGDQMAKLCRTRIMSKPMPVWRQLSIYARRSLSHSSKTMYRLPLKLTKTSLSLHARSIRNVHPRESLHVQNNIWVRDFLQYTDFAHCSCWDTLLPCRNRHSLESDIGVCLLVVRFVNNAVGALAKFFSLDITIMCCNTVGRVGHCRIALRRSFSCHGSGSGNGKVCRDTDMHTLQTKLAQGRSSV